MRTSTLFFSLLILVVGCTRETSDEIPEFLKDLENLTVYPANPEPLHDIELIQEVSYGETEEVFFGRRIKHIAIDNSGRVFIADSDNHTIHAYNPDGTYLQRIGREGRGPGEFQFIWDLKIQNHQIHVLDHRQFKISVFDLNTFNFVADYNISLDDHQNTTPSWLSWTREKGLFYQPTNMFIRTDGTYLVLFSDSSVGPLVLDSVEGRTYETSIFSPVDGTFIEHDLLSFRWSGQVLIYDIAGGGIMVMLNIPYKRSSRFDFANGQFVLGWTEDMLFKFYDQDGGYQRAFYYPYDNISFELNEAISFYEHELNINAIRSDEHPETWPAYHSLIVDDENRLWVSTITNDHKVYEWWVMAPDGELLATFTWSRDREIKIVKNGYAYALERDRDTDLIEVVRYRIELK